MCATATVALCAPVRGIRADRPRSELRPGEPGGQGVRDSAGRGAIRGRGHDGPAGGANVPFGVGIELPGGGPGKRDTPANGRSGRADRADGPARSGAETSEELAARIATPSSPGHRRAHLLALAVLLPAGLLALILWHAPASQPDRKNCLTLRATGGPPAWPPLAARKCGSAAGCGVSP